MSRDEHLFLEEQEHKKNSKDSRQERKRLSQKDRSKYKKTDLAKLVEPPLQEGELGRVLQINPEGTLCQIGHNFYVCSLKGLLKKEKILSKNVLAVGDEVIIANKLAEPQIIQILPRRTVLSRADNLSRKKEQVIAANIDQVFITASLKEPIFKPFLIDRYLIAAYKGGVKPIILITKIDLIDSTDEKQKEEALAALDSIKSIAHSLNIPLIAFSAKTLQGLDLLKSHLEGQTSVFSGQSGVGKSSIINLITTTIQATGAVAPGTLKGSHTTSQARMLPLKDMEGYCVDTPGIRSFGLWAIDKEDIGRYFTEIDEASKLCKFPNCHHLSEPDCNVKQLCEKGLINPLRFGSYLVLMAEADQTHLKR